MFKDYFLEEKKFSTHKWWWTREGKGAVGKDRRGRILRWVNATAWDWERFKCHLEAYQRICNQLSRLNSNDRSLKFHPHEPTRVPVMEEVRY